MKILIAGKYSPFGHRPIGGVQSWIKTVANELTRLGHDVTVWEAGQGISNERFDLGILANYSDTRAVWGQCDQVVNVSHGIIEAEKPAPEADRHVFTSEGVRDHWGMAGNVIRQPIDLSFWSADAVQRDLLLRYSYRGGLGFVADVARDMGLKYGHIRNVSHSQARGYFSRSVCVLATGRAALEAMACGAPVVICDHRSAYQGPLLDPDTFGAMNRNYSGRGGFEPTPNVLRAMIGAAIEYGSMRQHVEQHHDVRQVVEGLL